VLWSRAGRGPHLRAGLRAQHPSPICGALALDCYWRRWR
jgi:hypothetical protein